MRDARLDAVAYKWATAAEPSKSGIVFMGTLPSNFSQKNVQHSKVDWGNLREILAAVEVGGVKLNVDDQYNPATGPEAELEALHAHHAGVVECESLAEVEIEHCLQQFEKEYVRSKTRWEDRRDPEVWSSILQAVKRSASTGAPWSWIAKENADALEDPVLRAKVVGLAIQRAEWFAEIDPDWLESTLQKDPAFLLKHGLADPVRIFVKKEIHPGRKVLSRKWRIIMSVSLVDRLVETLLCFSQDEKEIEHWRDIPSKCGFGMTDEAIHDMIKYAQDKRLNTSSDASGWDATVPMSLLKLEAERRVRLAADVCPEWAAAVRNVFLSSAYRIMMTSDGHLYRRVVPGGQASGRKVTSSSNSAMRRAVDIIAGMHFGVETASMCMGDDCHTHLGTVDPVEYTQFVFNQFGIRLTDVVREESDFEFCSHRFVVDANVAYPINPLKSLANFAASLAGGVERDQALQTLSQLKNNWRHLPGGDALLHVAQTMLADRCPLKESSEDGESESSLGFLGFQHPQQGQVEQGSSGLAHASGGSVPRL